MAVKKKKPARKKPASKKPAASKKVAKKKPAKKKVEKKPAKKKVEKKPAKKKVAAAAPAVPVPTMASVLGAMFGRNAGQLAEAVGGVDWERVARYLLSYDWKNGHFSRFGWDGVLAPLDGKVVKSGRSNVLSAFRKGQVRGLARALRDLDWKALCRDAPLGDMQWFGDVIELVVSLYNYEKTEIVCPVCPYPYRDVYGRLFKMEREISGREVPLVCGYEGDGQHCPPDLAADSWTRLDDLTGQDGRSVRTDGLSDRCITRTKIGFDISDVPEGGGRVVMTEEERERVHVQHAGRVPAEPASPDGTFIVSLAGFVSTDVVQVVASGFYTEADGPRRPVVVDWELNEMNSEVSFAVYGVDGELLDKEDQFITIDWIASTR